MAKISTLALAAGLNGSEEVLIVQGGLCKKTTISALVVDKVRETLATETLGRPTITTTTTAPGANAGLFIVAQPLRHTGKRHTLRIRKGNAGAATIKIGRYTRLFNGDFQPVAGAALVPVDVPGSATSQIAISMFARAGDYIGYSIPVTEQGMAYLLATAGDSGGYWYHNVAEPAGVFTASGGAAPQTNIQLQIGLDGDYALAFDDLDAELKPRIDDHQTRLSAAEGAVATNTSALGQVTESVPEVVLSRYDAANTTFLTATPAANAWAPGWLGTSLAEGTPINHLKIRPHRPVGAITFEATLFSRPIATTSVPSGGDTQEWPAAVVASALGMAENAFGDIMIDAPVAVANDQARSYYLQIVAKDADGTVINSGYARGADGTSLGQVQRGYYRAGAIWAMVSAGAALAIEVLTDRFQVKASALPEGTGSGLAPAAPSKKRGMLLMLGRSELVFDNTTPTTHRRVFALPANVTRVLEVVFSHASTFAVPITRAAIAPLVSAANFAAAGAAWTPLTFNGGAVSRNMPVSSAGRYGLMASDPVGLALHDRTDTPGAAKLVIVSAYMGGGGSPVLLGKAASDDYRTGWEARADFPSVMRWNTGDCVTTPASFASTANQINGTPIAGLVVESDTGEIMTLGFVGDSITNGAGITGAYGVQYGQGWAEKLAYGLNSKYRGVLPVLLGWSGTSMTNIRYQASDLYGFCAANGLPVPNILFAPNASPNSMGTPLLESQMTAQRALSDEIVNTALAAGSQVVKWLCLPVDPAVKDLDPSTDPNDGDKFRRNYNDADRALAALQVGVIAADYDAAVTSGFDADGQALFDDDDEDDGIHPNAPGHTLLAQIGTRAARAAMPSAGFAVGGLVT